MTTATRTPAAPSPASAALSVDALVDATPAERDRTVDLLRAFSIVVVILWHWVFSVTHVNGRGALTMPNPVGDVRLMWLATWLLQVMPVFFFVGGFSNLAALDGERRKGGTAWTFLRGRLDRLGRPVVVFVGLWAIGDTLARLVAPGYQGVLHWGVVVFVPLWFLGMYALAVALADLGRFRFGLEVLGIPNAGLVFLFAHQLGYFWRDGTLTRCPRRTLWAIALGGLTALIVLTNIGVYPRSMVSVRSDAISNMFPTTACIAALAVFQCGVAMLLRPRLERWLTHRRPWKAVVSLNAVAMTLFTWHMTALVTAIGLWQLAGQELLARPTAAWWATRPLCLIGPGIILAGLVALFAPVEIGGRRRPADDRPPNPTVTAGSVGQGARSSLPSPRDC